MATNDNDADAPDAALDEAAGLAETHLWAARMREDWPGDGEREQARELLAPLDPATQKRIVDAVLTRHRQARSAAQAARSVVTPIAGAPSRRWWLASLPATAAMAAAVTLWVVDAGSSRGVGAGGSLAGEVHATLASRGEPAALEVPVHDTFLLDCHVPGRTLRVVGVHAVPVVTGDDERSPESPGWRPRRTAADGATIEIKPFSLARGAWSFSCEVYEPATGQLMQLVPAATLTLK